MFAGGFIARGIENSSVSRGTHCLKNPSVEEIESFDFWKCLQSLRNCSHTYINGKVLGDF